MELRTKATVAEGITKQSEAEGARFVEYQPGNGTRYVLVLTELGRLGPEACTACGLGREGTGVLVSWVNGFRAPSMVVPSDGGYLAPNYVERKLNSSMADAVVLAELIGTLLGCEFMSCEDYAKGM
jgi:hypothetical protein